MVQGMEDMNTEIAALSWEWNQLVLQRSSVQDIRSHRKVLGRPTSP